MPYVIGLTGNIGCGKSTVGQMLVELGADYVDADLLVHQLYEPDTPETRAVLQEFGSQVMAEDGRVDRARLGEIVFSDQAAMARLEAILHPPVRQLIRRAIASSQHSVVVVDAIKLFESGLYLETDAVWVVTCELGEQERRLVQSRRLSSEQARLRIQAQAPQAEKARRAHVVIDNGGSREATRRQVERAWRPLTSDESVTRGS